MWLRSKHRDPPNCHVWRESSEVTAWCPPDRDGPHSDALGNEVYYEPRGPGQYPHRVASSAAMPEAPVQPRHTLKDRVVTRLYRTFPPAKYWSVRQGYLKRIGWVRSNWTHQSVDANGEPMPWLTYPAVTFIEERVKPHMTIFEFGSGQSTLWWARRVQAVHSVEDDEAWFRLVSATLPGNVDLRLADASTDAYARSIQERDAAFDVVIIDGSDRNGCAHHALASIKPDGVIVFDNTEEPNAFGPGLALLREHGFRRIDFHGMAPLNGDPHATSVLYRPANCFEI